MKKKEVVSPQDDETVLGMIKSFAELQSVSQPEDEPPQNFLDKIPPEEMEKMKNNNLITDSDFDMFFSAIEKSVKCA